MAREWEYVSRLLKEGKGRENGIYCSRGSKYAGMM